MVQPKRNHSANDNAPLRQPILRRNSPFPVPQVVARKTVNPIKTYQRKMAWAWAIPLFTILAGLFVFFQNSPLTDLFWPSLVAGVVLFFTAARAETDSRLRNISGLLMVASLTTCLAALLAQNGFSLIGMELTLLISILAIVIGWTFKSKPSVLLSVFAGLLYLASYYPDLGLTAGLTDQKSFLGASLMPVIIIGQIFLAQKLRSSIIVLTSITAGYIWLGTLGNNMPMAPVIGLGFAIAAAHYWLGKAGEEAGKFGASIHRIFAWTIALGSAIYIQSIWLNVDAGQAKPFWPPDNLWLALLGLAILAVFVISLMRYKSSHVSLIGIFIICAAVLVIPLATIKPNLVYVVFDTIPGLDARPGLGLVLGAVIIAIGFMWVVGGLKRGNLLDMSLGAAVIGIETLVVFQPARLNADFGVIFVVSLICALCIGGLIAGATPDRTDSLKNFA